MAARKSGIRRKLMVILLATCSVVLVLTCAGFFVYELVTFRQSVLRQLTILGEITAANSTAALAFENHEDAVEILAALKADRHVVRACLYSKDGRLFATYPAAAPATLFPAAPSADGFRFAETAVFGFLPVIQNGQRRLGTLYLQSDLGVVYDRFRNYVKIVSLVFAVSLLTAYLLGSVLQRQISRPVLALTAVAQEVAERRDYSVRAVRTTEDELGRLTDAFNQMLGEIEGQTRALKESEDLFRGMAETMPQIVWTSQPDGTADYYNQRWFDYSGLTFEQTRALGGSVIAHPDDRQRSLEQWADCVRSGGRYQCELRLKRASDGSYRWHIGRAASVRNSSGEIVKWIGTWTDIDDAKRAEEEVRTLNLVLEERVRNRTAELEAAMRELESFSYSVSHDLRAPLRHVEGYVEMLTSEAGAELTGTALRYLKTIQDATGEMGRLIDDLLAFSRVGRLDLEHGHVSLDAVLRNVLRGYQKDGTHTVRWTVGELPEVFGDASVLRQVLSNLIDNAVKYSRFRDAPEIEIGCAGESDGQAVLFVRDNGAGFDMQYAHKLFGVFQRLHKSEEFEGTGIGLATVRRIISRHGGRTWAEGEVGRGATFYFTLKPTTPVTLKEEITDGKSEADPARRG